MDYTQRYEIAAKIASDIDRDELARRVAASSKHPETSAHILRQMVYPLIPLKRVDREDHKEISRMVRNLIPYYLMDGRTTTENDALIEQRRAERLAAEKEREDKAKALKKEIHDRVAAGEYIPPEEIERLGIKIQYNPIPPIFKKHITYEPDSGYISDDYDGLIYNVWGKTRKTGRGRRSQIHYYSYQTKRVAWYLATGENPLENIRHIDGDNTNYEASNLQAVSSKRVLKDLI